MKHTDHNSIVSFWQQKKYTVQRCGATEMWHVRHTLLGLKDATMTNCHPIFTASSQWTKVLQQEAGGKSGSANAEAMTSRQKHIHRFWSSGKPAADCAWPCWSKPAKLSESKIWLDQEQQFLSHQAAKSWATQLSWAIVVSVSIENFSPSKQGKFSFTKRIKNVTTQTQPIPMDEAGEQKDLN